MNVFGLCVCVSAIWSLSRSTSTKSAACRRASPFITVKYYMRLQHYGTCGGSLDAVLTLTPIAVDVNYTMWQIAYGSASPCLPPVAANII